MPPLAPAQLPLVDKWLRSVLWESEVPGAGDAAGLEIHRLKARLVLQNGEVKMVQGVREVFEIFDAPTQTNEALAASPPQTGKLVLIGRRVQAVDLQSSFLQALGQ